MVASWGRPAILSVGFAHRVGIMTVTHILRIALIALTFIGLAVSLYRLFRALRAEMRFRSELEKIARNDEKIKSYISSIHNVNADSIDDELTDLISKEILSHVSVLPENERHFVQGAITQNNKSGGKRYIKSLLSSA